MAISMVIHTIRFSTGAGRTTQFSPNNRATGKKACSTDMKK
ncbi:hypothetical protein YPPY56_2338 [Yersinia pestis PY-56]|nr:hypothetical protein YPPY56_2338 [Yersinia pestis PY-56]EIS96000.1 hypothetical protein YPPY89_2490 [Yersinia pestis PY-89]EIT40673.1 hypothetical protein YPPY99_2404 [Yersinia pestis PY-99]EIT59025.1 hypothetical protein YPPY103_2414 [Yersinia pestis PY-103]